MYSAVTVKNISVAYQSESEETEALKDISFSVEEGEFVSIVGPSGCGKSTLLSVLSGLIRPTSGKALIGGRPAFLSDKTGYMLQNDHLFEWRSIFSNAVIGLQIKHKMTDENIGYVNELLKTYGLWDFRNAHPSQLSGGMRQRAALIRTLAVKPDLLLLDEAFSGLDYQTRLDVSGDIYRIIKHEQKTAIMVTHDISEAAALSDRVIVLSQRPATVAGNIPISPELCREDPIRRRESPHFGEYYNMIWRELRTDAQ